MSGFSRTVAGDPVVSGISRTVVVTLVVSGFSRTVIYRPSMLNANNLVLPLPSTPDRA